MDWIIVCSAGFLGGMLNAVAGGGSFFTLPALIFVGVSPITANSTGTAALLPGYLASAWRFRHDIEYPAGLNFTVITLIAILGGGVGAVILLLTDEQIFSILIPWLILLATIAFIVGPRILQRKNTVTEKAEFHLKHSGTQVVIPCLVLFAVCTYGGYFNGGLGIVLLAALELIGQTNLHGMNGLKNLLSALLTAVAVAVYAFGDVIAGKYFISMGLMAVAGGYFGAAIAYRLSEKIMRYFIVFVGCIMSILFFIKFYL